MKSIQDYIKESHFNSLDFGIKKENEYNEMLDFFDNEIPNDVLMKFNNNENYDYMLENFKTYNHRKLIDKIKSLYGDSIKEIDEEESNSKNKTFHIVFKSLSDIKIKNDEKFISLLNFFNYKITYDKGYTLYLEPNESELCDEYIFNKCHNIVYHFTNKSSIQRILERGLRCKGGNEDSYRRFEPRIFVYGNEKSLKQDKINVRKFIEEVVDNIDGDYKNSCIIRIDLNKCKNIHIYKDSTINDSHSFYITRNIPSSCLKEININILK